MFLSQNKNLFLMDLHTFYTPVWCVSLTRHGLLRKTPYLALQTFQHFINSLWSYFWSWNQTWGNHTLSCVGFFVVVVEYLHVSIEPKTHWLTKTKYPLIKQWPSFNLNHIFFSLHEIPQEILLIKKDEVCLLAFLNKAWPKMFWIRH